MDTKEHVVDVLDKVQYNDTKKGFGWYPLRSILNKKNTHAVEVCPRQLYQGFSIRLGYWEWINKKG